MKVSVTLEHIKQAQRARGKSWASANQAERECPVAQALRAQWPNCRVSNKSVVPDGNPKGDYLMLPLLAQKYTEDFDATGEAKPIAFTLGSA